MDPAACPLCQPSADPPLWRDDVCRVILAPEPDYPGFCRVIWRAHVAEMTDLTPAERGRLMSVVFAVEDALRAALRPDKVNLASLGNVVPHLHWHVIPRYRDDPSFPGAVWAPAVRAPSPRALDVDALRARLRASLGPPHP